MKPVVRIAVAVCVGWAGSSTARAQYPPQGAPQGGPFQPYQTPGIYQNQMYNRKVQPLSPYLNLFRGGIPAVDYYYGVRPGLPTGGYVPPAGSPIQGARAIQPVFLPVNPATGSRDIIPPGFEYETAPKETTLLPAGHTVQFANTGGYFPGLSAPRPGGFTKPAAKPVKKP